MELFPVEIETHIFEDGELKYLVSWNDRKVENGWIQASDLEDEEIVRNYWSKLSSKLPFRNDTTVDINIDSLETASKTKDCLSGKNMIFAVHMQGNAIDEYHLLQRGQMNQVNGGFKKVLDYYASILKAEL